MKKMKSNEFNVKLIEFCENLPFCLNCNINNIGELINKNILNIMDNLFNIFSGMNNNIFSYVNISLI